jgi:hypothetical protein
MFGVQVRKALWPDIPATTPGGFLRATKIDGQEDHCEEEYGASMTGWEPSACQGMVLK